MLHPGLADAVLVHIHGQVVESVKLSGVSAGRRDGDPPWLGHVTNEGFKPLVMRQLQRGRTGHQHEAAA